MTGTDAAGSPGLQDSPGVLPPRSWLDRWEQRELPVLARLPYVMLGFCALLAVLTSVRGWQVDLGLCGLAFAWLLAGSALGCGIGPMPPAGSVARSAPWLAGLSWASRRWVAAAFFVGLVAIMTVMVVRTPWFGFFTFTGYFYAAQLPVVSWRVAGVAAVAILTGGTQAGGLPTATSGPAGAAVFAGTILVNLGVSGAFIWFAWVGHLQGERRSRLLDELREANQRLEATLEENAGLHAQLLAQAREAGVLDERQRMAREIHDTLAQGLTGIITQLQAAEQAGAGSGEQHHHLAAATRLARESLTEARRSVDALRPEPLERASFGEALAGVAAKWSALHGIPVQVTTTGAGRPLPPEAEVVLLRTAQEALANVAKHAAASRAWVTLSYMDGEVAVDVRDDGRGFAAGLVAARVAADGGDSGSVGGATPMSADGGAAASTGGGFGLLAMRQRVEGLSGTLQVESEPGEGTTISACVPTARAPRPMAQPAVAPDFDPAASPVVMAGRRTEVP